ncbi:hypothetical protein HDU97_002151, partial [Phlyctochytrium planicorne]
TFEGNYLQGKVPDFIYDIRIRTYGFNCFTIYRSDGVVPFDRNDGDKHKADQRPPEDCKTQVSTSAPNRTNAGSPTISQPGIVVINPDGVTSFIPISITPSVPSVAVTMNGTVLVVPGKPTQTFGEGSTAANTGVQSVGSEGGGGGVAGVSIALICGVVASVFVLVFAAGLSLFVVRMKKKLAADLKAPVSINGSDIEASSAVAVEASQISRDSRDRRMIRDLEQSEGMNNVSASTTARAAAVVSAIASDINVSMFSNLNAGAYRPALNGTNGLQDGAGSGLVLPTVPAAGSAERPKANYVAASTSFEDLDPSVKEVTNWSVEEVATFLESVGVGNWVVQTLKERGVNGYQLWVMTEERLGDLGVGRGGEVVIAVVERLRGACVKAPPDYQD